MQTFAYKKLSGIRKASGIDEKRNVSAFEQISGLPLFAAPDMSSNFKTGNGNVEDKESMNSSSFTSYDSLKSEEWQNKQVSYKTYEPTPKEKKKSTKDVSPTKSDGHKKLNN